MKYDAESYRSRTGLNVYRRRFEALVPAQAGALFVHGLGEHGGRHDRHLELFAQHGIHCVAVDLPGHGRTEGLRGHIASLEMVTELIHENLEQLRSEIGNDRHVGLLGHSMGGFLSLYYLTQFPNMVDFSWISSPLIDPASKVTWLKRSLAMMIERVHPRFTLHSGVTSHLCKRDEEAIASTRADALVHRRMTVRLGSILVRASRALHDPIQRIHPELTLLMTHGGRDRICCPQASRHYFDQLPCASKHYALFDDLLHEPFNDIGKERFYACLESWITSEVLPHCGSANLHGRAARNLSDAA